MVLSNGLITNGAVLEPPSAAIGLVWNGITHYVTSNCDADRSTTIELILDSESLDNLSNNVLHITEKCCILKE